MNSRRLATMLRTRTMTAALLVLTGAALAAPVAAQPAGSHRPPDAGAAGQAAPDDPPATGSLEELMAIQVESVYGASRRDQLVTDAPSSVSIVTRDEIRTFGWDTLADVLRGIRGFYLTYDRNYTYVGSRGFGRPTDYNNRILVLIDGHRVNDNVYDSVLVGQEFPLDLDLVQRIEIIRGPGSALYGTSAFFAVINVITRQGGSLDGSEAGVRAASATSYTLRGSTGRQLAGGRQYLFSASHQRRGGVDGLYYPEYDDAATNFGLTSGTDREEASRIYGSTSIGRFTLQGLFGTREKRVPTGSWGTTFNDPRNRTVDTRGWIDLAYRQESKRGSVSGRVFYDHASYEGELVFDDGALINRDFSVGRWFGTEVTGTRRLGRHLITAGLEYRMNVAQDQWNYDEDPYLLLLDDRRHSHQAALYAQDDVTLTSTLTAVLGGRYDWWSGKGTGHPRVGLVYRPDGDTAIKALYGEAYRRPNVYELYYDEGASVANAALRPETLRTSEVVVERYVGRRTRLTATGYYTRISGLITQVENEALLLTTAETGLVSWYDNQERVRAAGAEVELEHRWFSGLLLRGNYTVQRTVDLDTGLRLSNSPGHLANVAIAVPSPDRRFTAAGLVHYVGMREALDGTPCPGYWLVNSTLSMRLTRTVELQTGVTNLLDRRYADPVGAEFVQSAIEQDGRAFFARAALRF